MSTQLRHHLDVIYRTLLDGKLPRNLSWADTIELIGQLGSVESQANDEFVFAVGTQRAFFKHPHAHELGVEEVSRLRKFLREAGSGKPDKAHQPRRSVVVIDHHAAHIYQDVNGPLPEGEQTIHPYDPFHFRHHLVHRKEAHYKGEHVPEEPSFYEEVAKELLAANEIVLIGHGTGKSSAVDHLSDYLKHNHPQTFQHLKGTETADLSALTEPEIEELAKQHMIAVV